MAEEAKYQQRVEHQEPLAGLSIGKVELGGRMPWCVMGSLPRPLGGSKKV